MTSKEFLYKSRRSKKNISLTILLNYTLDTNYKSRVPSLSSHNRIVYINTTGIQDQTNLIILKYGHQDSINNYRKEVESFHRVKLLLHTNKMSGRVSETSFSSQLLFIFIFKLAKFSLCLLIWQEIPDLQLISCIGPYLDDFSLSIRLHNTITFTFYFRLLLQSEIHLRLYGIMEETPIRRKIEQVVPLKTDGRTCFCSLY